MLGASELPWEQIRSIFGQGFPFGVSVAALFMLAKMMLRFQHDFADSYSKRVVEMDSTITVLRKENDTLRLELRRLERREARLSRALVIAGGDPDKIE